MPTYLSPGVYVEEMEAGARPIEGVGTAVAAFVGLASAGPFNTPTLVTNWSQFTGIFGDFVDGLLSASRRVRVLPERWGRLLRRSHRRQRGGVPCRPGRADGDQRRRRRSFSQRGRLPGPGPGRGSRGQRHLRRGRRQRHRGRHRGRVQAGRQEGRQGRGDLRQPDDEEGPAERRHRRQRPVEADPHRGARGGGRAGSAAAR